MRCNYDYSIHAAIGTARNAWAQLVTVTFSNCILYLYIYIYIYNNNNIYNIIILYVIYISTYIYNVTQVNKPYTCTFCVYFFRISSQTPMYCKQFYDKCNRIIRACTCKRYQATFPPLLHSLGTRLCKTSTCTMVLLHMYANFDQAQCPISGV